MQWGRICWRDWFLPGALSGWAACCRSFYHGLVVVTALLPLASPLWWPHAGSMGSLGVREPLLFPCLHRLRFVLCFTLSSSQHGFISLRPSKNGAKTLQGYFPRRKSLVHICSWAPFLLYKRHLWGFSAAFISVGDTEEVLCFFQSQILISHNYEAWKKSLALFSSLSCSPWYFVILGHYLFTSGFKNA